MRHGLHFAGSKKRSLLTLVRSLRDALRDSNPQ
jgi:hypothetical protein